jgi:hypothetical protein
MLFVEIALVAVVAGLLRQAIISNAPAFLIPAALVFGAAYGLFRLMIGAEPPDLPPGPSTGPMA